MKQTRPIKYDHNSASHECPQYTTSVLRCDSCFLRNNSPYSNLHWGKWIIWLLLLIRRVQRLTFDFLLRDRRLLSASGGSSPTATNTRCSSAGLRDPHTLRNAGLPQSTVIGGLRSERTVDNCVCIAGSRGPSHPGRAGRKLCRWRSELQRSHPSCPVFPSPRRHDRGLNVLLFLICKKEVLH